MKNLRSLLALVGALAAPAALALCAGSQAQAAIESFDVSFTAGGFTSVYGQPAPEDPATGSFRITFDPTQTYTDSTTGITLNSLNITLGSALSFDYSPTGNGNGLADELVVGGLDGGANTITVDPSSNDFYLHIYTFTASPEFEQLGYSQTTYTAAYWYNNPLGVGGPAFGTGSVTVTPVTTPVPEPATWAMLLAGFAGLSLLGYRQTAKARVAA
jgi:hypothetical protein